MTDCLEPPVDHARRRFLTLSTGLIGGVGALLGTVPFVSSWLPSEQAKSAGAPISVDVSKLLPGALLTVEWRGKPVWVLHRTAEMLASLDQLTEELRDPHSQVLDQQPTYAQNTPRSIKPEYLVLVGVCTHLGCSPSFKPEVGQVNASWKGGFYCPCHGSMFDLAGRVFKGVPAPLNLEVPPYTFLSDQVIKIGEDGGAAA